MVAATGEVKGTANLLIGGVFLLVARAVNLPRLYDLALVLHRPRPPRGPARPIGAVWEVIEWSSDGVLGSNLSMGNDDTVGDLIADGLGSMTGGLLLVAWARFGWGSVRRVPGENRCEETNA